MSTYHPLAYGHTILIVDDDPIFRKMLEAFLLKEGMEVLTATNGHEGVCIALETQPDLILMDAQMPELDGVEACHQIKDAFPDADVQVLMVTASNDEALIESAFEAGASDYITKPINWTLLRHRVRYELGLGSHFKALRNSETRFRILFEQAPVAYVVLDQAGHIVQFNPALGQLLRTSTLQGRSLCEFIEAADCATLRADLKALISEQRDIDGHILRLNHDQGHPTYVRFTARATPAVDTQRTEILCILEDITETVLNTRTLEKQANTDPLTGLLNRRTFEQTLTLHLRSTRKTGMPLSLAMIDIDHFKHINDTYGHAAGDQVLQHLSQLISECLQRDQDRAYRLGGEEFALLLPDTTLEGVCQVVERLRQTIMAHPARTDTGEIPFTISAGAACSCDHDFSPEKFYKAADDALYAAKRAGRNRSFMYQRNTIIPCIAA